MKEALKTVRRLYQEGKLHRRLVIRIVLLALVTGISLGVVFVDVGWRHLPLLPVVTFIIPGFFFGFFIMSKIHTIKWDVYEEMIILERFDWVGFFILLAYFAVRILGQQYIGGKYTNSFYISGYSLALFFGIVLGRLLGISKRIHRLSLGEAFDRLQ